MRAGKRRKSRRFGGGSIVALILLLGAAWSFYGTFIWKRPPLPLVILSERAVLDMGDPAIIDKYRAMSLSPDGRYLLFFREAKTGPAQVIYQPFLLDLGTGEQVKVPFPPSSSFQFNRGGVPDSFTTDGNYIHLLTAPTGDGEPVLDQPWVLLYDIRNRTARTIKIGYCRRVVSDDASENLLVTRAYAQDTQQIAVVPVAGGPIEWYTPFRAVVQGRSSKERAIATTNWGKTGSDISIVDLTSGKILNTFRMPENWQSGPYFPPYHTADGRFICFSIFLSQRNRVAQVRNLVFRFLPVTGRSPDSEVKEVQQAILWDIARDKFTALDHAIVVGPGPSPSSVFIVDTVGWEPTSIHVLDLASGQDYMGPPQNAEGFIGASGKYFLRVRPDKAGHLWLWLVEIGLPVAR